MNPRSEIVRIDRELDALLALPAADAARRITQAYQIADDQTAFVLALIGRLLVRRATAGESDAGH